MVYGMNLFDLVEGKEDLYREYWKQARPILEKTGGRVALACRTQRSLHERPQGYFVLVEFPDAQAYERFMQQSMDEHVHALRNESTQNYVWHLLEPWDMTPVRREPPRQQDVA